MRCSQAGPEAVRPDLYLSGMRMFHRPGLQRCSKYPGRREADLPDIFERSHGNGEASFGVAGEDWERIEITEPPYKYSDARFYAEYYNGFQAPFLVCIWNKDYAELEDILKNTSEKLYKAYRKEMEWDMTYERLDKNLHSVAKGLGEFYLNGTR